MRVAAEVVEDLLGAGEGSLRVDHPFGLAGRAEVVGEAAGVAEGLQPAGEVQLSGLEGVLQRLEEDATEVARKDPDRQEEPGAAGNPAAAVVCEPPTRDDAVQMRMMDERLAPGVEDGEEADLGAEVARVGGNRAECLGDGSEEETVDDGLVLGGDLGDRRGHGEDDVEVLGGQQVLPAPFEPRGAGQRLTGRTVAVAAGVVPDAPMAAVVLRHGDRGARHGRRSGDVRSRFRYGPRKEVQRTRGRADRAGGEQQVAGRGLQAPMPEQKLNRTQVGARLEEVDGECVAERMWRNRLGEARASGGEPAGIPDRFRRDRLLRALAGK